MGYSKPCQFKLSPALQKYYVGLSWTAKSIKFRIPKPASALDFYTFKNMKDIITNDGKKQQYYYICLKMSLGSSRIYGLLAWHHAASMAWPSQYIRFRIQRAFWSSVMLSCCKARRNSSKSKLPDLSTYWCEKHTGNGWVAGGCWECHS